jgi:hypothetical protein
VRSLALCLLLTTVVRAADIPDQRVSAGEASFLFSEIRVSRESALQKEGVPHFYAVVRSQVPVAMRNVRFSVEFILSGGRTETVNVRSGIFYANHAQALSYTFLPPYAFSAAEITGVNIRLLGGQMASSRPGMTYDGFVASSEPCLVEYLQATRRSGPEQQQSLTELLDRGCGSFVLKPLIVTPITSKHAASGASIIHASFSPGARLDECETETPANGWISASKVVRTSVLEWRPIGTIIASTD